MQERNTDWVPPICTQTGAHTHPDWGSNLQPRHTPLPGIEPSTLLAMGQCSNRLGHTSQGKTENLKSSKRKTTSYIQGNAHKNVSWLFNRNFAGQREGQDIFNTMKENKPKTKNTPLDKVIIQSWRRVSQTSKSYGVHHHYDITRNDKRNSLSGKKKDQN